MMNDELLQLLVGFVNAALILFIAFIFLVCVIWRIPIWMRWICIKFSCYGRRFVNFINTPIKFTWLTNLFKR